MQIKVSFLCNDVAEVEAAWAISSRKMTVSIDMITWKGDVVGFHPQTKNYK